MHESLDVALRPSRWHLGSLLAVYGASAGLILTLSLHEVARWGLLGVLALGLGGALYQLRTVRRVARIAHCNGRWTVQRAGRIWPLGECCVTYLSNWLIVLRMKEAGRRATHLPLFCDTCDREDFRRLALLLRTTGA